MSSPPWDLSAMCFKQRITLQAYHLHQTYFSGQGTEIHDLKVKYSLALVFIYIWLLNMAKTNNGFSLWAVSKCYVGNELQMLHSLQQVKLEMLSMLNEIYPQAFSTMNENSWKKNVLFIELLNIYCVIWETAHGENQIITTVFP